MSSGVGASRPVAATPACPASDEPRDAANCSAKATAAISAARSLSAVVACSARYSGGVQKLLKKGMPRRIAARRQETRLGLEARGEEIGGGGRIQTAGPEPLALVEQFLAPAPRPLVDLERRRPRFRVRRDGA